MNILSLILIIGVIVAGVDPAHANEAGQQFQGFNLQGYTDDGKKAWVVNGDKADILGSDIKISNVDAESYGDQKVNLTAETGTINQISGNIHLEKDVVITSEQGAQLLTDSLDWSRNEDLVETDDDVVITNQGLTATGKGMKARPGLKTAQIHEDVTVTMDTAPKAADPKTVTITCDGPMVIDQAKAVATFETNVVAVQEDQTLSADRMEVYFDETNQKIKELICLGHVVIVRGENKTFAEKAVYNGAEQKLVLSGRPKLILVTGGSGAITSIGD